MILSAHITMVIWDSLECNASAGLQALKHVIWISCEHPDILLIDNKRDGLTSLTLSSKVPLEVRYSMPLVDRIIKPMTRFSDCLHIYALQIKLATPKVMPTSIDDFLQKTCYQRESSNCAQRLPV